MSGFFLKRFEIEGLNCSFSDLPFDRNDDCFNGGDGCTTPDNPSTADPSSYDPFDGGPNADRHKYGKKGDSGPLGERFSKLQTTATQAIDQQEPRCDPGYSNGHHHHATNRTSVNGSTNNGSANNGSATQHYGSHIGLTPSNGRMSASGLSKKKLSDVICHLSERDHRFRFELVGGKNQKPKLSRLIWSYSQPPQNASSTGGMEGLPNSDAWLGWPEQYYELESTENGHTKTEFRYTISDQFGQTVESNVDAIRPIFSNDGPMVESGYSVRIDLVAISLPHYGHTPLLARLALRDVSWIQDSDLILDL